MSFGSNEFDIRKAFKLKTRTILKWNPEPIIKAAQSAGEKALEKMASYVWTSAHQSIRYGRYRGKGIYKRRKSKPSPPGTAMGFGTGWMRESLVVQRKDNREMHIGFYRGSRVGDLHEWGGTKTLRKIAHYPARPTMQLALEKSERDMARKFPEEFAKYFGAGGRATMGESE
jgi:phage gpG-like protein